MVCLFVSCSCLFVFFVFVCFFLLLFVCLFRNWFNLSFRRKMIIKLNCGIAMLKKLYVCFSFLSCYVCFSVFVFYLFVGFGLLLFIRFIPVCSFCFKVLYHLYWTNANCICFFYLFSCFILCLFVFRFYSYYFYWANPKCKCRFFLCK
jgi:hypothetical protein